MELKELLQLLFSVEGIVLLTVIILTIVMFIFPRLSLFVLLAIIFLVLRYIRYKEEHA
ncbi:MAG: hypothetical protein GXO42_03115 [bacterium]|nr:hypothetical protein [bacterium]